MVAAWCLLLLVASGGDDPLDGLAAAGRWEELREVATRRLADDADDAVAHAWFGRDLLDQAIELQAGSRLARDLSLALVDRSVEHLQRAAEALGEERPETVAWWFEARLVRREARAGLDEPDADLAADLERVFAARGQAELAALRGRLALLQGEDGVAGWFGRASDAAPERADLALLWARELAVSGRTDEALAAFERALAADDPPLDDLLATLASILPGPRQAAERSRLLTRMAERPAWSASGLLAWYRAHALRQLGDGEGAVAVFDAATEGRGPEVDRAHASHLLAVGRPDEALALLMPHAEQGDWPCYEMAITAAGALAGQRRHEDAVRACDALLAIEPRHELVLWNRALTLWKGGRDDDAQGAFDSLVERLPGRSDVLNDAALAAWGAGRRSRARQLLEGAVALPGSIDARENLALLLSEDAPEQRQRALDLLEQVLDEEPERPRALRLRRALLRGR